jgi:hypothetical protein
MRLLIWMLGVECTMVAMMQAYQVARAWVWVFWLWFGLWSVVGVAVVFASLVRSAAFSPRGPALRAPATHLPQRAKAEGGE